MPKYVGYFLAEILISLFLCASISLLLLKQQWQVSQFTNLIQTRLQSLNSATNNYERNMQGFSLSEMLICLLLASLILTGLVQQYTQVYRQDKILTKTLEENLDLQLVTELLTNSLRSAGFTPCGYLNDLQQHENQEFVAVSLFKDLIETKRMSENYAEFAQVLDALDFLNKQKRQPKFKQVMISDCLHVVIIDYALQDANVEKILDFILKNYQPPIYIGEVIREKFWLKNRSTKSASYNSITVKSQVHTQSMLIKSEFKQQVASKKDLYYKFNHAEKLVDNVKFIQGEWVANNFIEVKFGFNDDKVNSLLVRIRNKAFA